MSECNERIGWGGVWLAVASLEDWKGEARWRGLSRQLSE